jgi:general stress protein YciG
LRFSSYFAHTFSFPDSGFGGDHERAVEAGKKGGSASHEDVYRPTEHGGVKKNGEPDKRTDPNHGFGGDRERASEEGKKGGAQNSTDDE